MLKFYDEHKKLEVKDNYDVIVVGGGMGGVGAALAAAREGMKTLIIEKMIAMGGQATFGHVVLYEPLDDGYGNQVIGGISSELCVRSIKYGYDSMPRKWKDHLKVQDLYEKKDDPDTWPNQNRDLRCSTFFNMPAMVFSLDEVTEEEGIDIVFDTVFCDVVMDGKRVEGVIVENKSGRYIYGAKMVVDASGDADVMFRAGASCYDRGNNLTYMAYDIDFERMQDAIEHNNMMRAFPDWLMLGFFPGINKGESEKFYGTSVEGVNGFIKKSRKLAFEHLKKKLSSSYTQVSVPAVPSFRTTRRINGMYTLTSDDYFRHFEDSIAVTGDWRRIGPVLEIPYRSLIDPEIENVLTAGRIIASDGDAWELTRCIPQAVLTGEAAGRAAAQAIRNNQTVQEIHVQYLQDSLVKNGGFIHMKDEVSALRRE